VAVYTVVHGVPTDVNWIGDPRQQQTSIMTITRVISHTAPLLPLMSAPSRLPVTSTAIMEPAAIGMLLRGTVTLQVITTMSL
jgi:hypothetical protein